MRSSAEDLVLMAVLKRAIEKDPKFNKAKVEGKIVLWTLFISTDQKVCITIGSPNKVCVELSEWFDFQDDYPCNNCLSAMLCKATNTGHSKDVEKMIDANRLGLLGQDLPRELCTIFMPSSYKKYGPQDIRDRLREIKIEIENAEKKLKSKKKKGGQNR